MTNDCELTPDKIAEAELVTRQRAQLTKMLTEAMRDEMTERVAFNTALSNLRKRERATKQAAEALGEFAQRRLGLVDAM